jgi:thiamine biosynthesis lipoprotein ApbE
MTSAPDTAGSALARLHRRRTRVLASALAVLAALTVWRIGSTPAPTPYEIAGLTMGTTYSVKVDAEVGVEARAKLRAAVEETLERIDRLMSTYDTSSELSRFNVHEGSDPFPVTRELMEVLTLAREISERSNGSFDVTVAPLVDAWGFGAGAQRSGRPDAATLEALTARVGYARIDIDPDAGTVTKTHPQTVVDLSAIAKGVPSLAGAHELPGGGRRRAPGGRSATGRPALACGYRGSGSGFTERVRHRRPGRSGHRDVRRLPRLLRG